MNLNDLKKNWNQFGKEDPYWAILTDPNMKGNKWDEAVFFETGRLRTDKVAKKLKRLKPYFAFNRALDFGCGAGRLTQGLANHFEKVEGVDIAKSMIDLANKQNKKENCTYHLNEKNDLSLFKEASFDLVFSEITLQHMEPKYAKNYIKEFIRLLKPNGIMMFQIPSKPDIGIHPYDRISNQIKRRLFKVFRLGKLGEKKPLMEMYWISINEMIDFLVVNGGQILQVNKNNAAGKTWDSYAYIVTKALKESTK